MLTMDEIKKSGETPQKPTKSPLDPRESMSKNTPKLLNRVHFPSGKLIIKQGDTAGRAYYIEEGSVEVFAEDGGHQLKVSEIEAGNIFGEMALINKEARTATVRALEPVTLTVISAGEMEQQFEQLNNKAARALMKVLVKRLKVSTQNQMEHYKNLINFQNRVTGVMDGINTGIKPEDREEFRQKITPLLENLQQILDQYQKP